MAAKFVAMALLFVHLHANQRLDPARSAEPSRMRRLGRIAICSLIGVATAISILLIAFGISTWP